MSGEQSARLIEDHLRQVLSSREYPKTACPSEVARGLSDQELDKLGAQSWRDVMGPVRQQIEHLRNKGQAEVLQRGVVVEEDLAIADLKGPIRVRNSMRG